MSMYEAYEPYEPDGSFEECLALHQGGIDLYGKAGALNGYFHCMANGRGLVKPLARLPKNPRWAVSPFVKEQLDRLSDVDGLFVGVLYLATFEVTHEAGGEVRLVNRATRYTKEWSKIKWSFEQPRKPELRHRWWFINGPTESDPSGWRAETARLLKELNDRLAGSDYRAEVARADGRL